MEATLHALGGIVLKGLPTFFLFLLLHFFMKKMFFEPMRRVLDARYEATTGAKKAADKALAMATAKAAEYEDALRGARTEVYKANEAMRKQWRDEQTAAVGAARESADERVKLAQKELAAEVENAKVNLGAESDRLASEIAAAVLRRTA
jgi:F-type H+-transporting ATPase subunit b